MIISIITAVFNNESTIADAIESVLSQKYDKLQYIVIDGASTDNTLKIINNYSSKISKIISEPDNGMYDALNKGIKSATGDVIGILNSDDFYANENVLSLVAEVFTENTDCDSVYGDLHYVSRGNIDNIVRYWESGDYHLDRLKYGWMPPHPTFFARRECYQQYGEFDTSYRISADYEIMLRFLAKHKISTRYIPEVLVKMRTGGISNNNISNLVKKSRDDFRAIGQHQIGGLTTLICKNACKIPQFLKR
jgi:glycosyltransferase